MKKIYIIANDLICFYKSEKTVFIILLLSLVITAFVLIYSYSFNEYRRQELEKAFDFSLKKYEVSLKPNTDYETAKEIISEIANAQFPAIESLQLRKMIQEETYIIGASKVENRASLIDGLWIEGEGFYSDELEESYICVLDERLLVYNELLYMTGESFYIENNRYLIKGVIQGIGFEKNIYIPIKVFGAQKHSPESVHILFIEQLTENQEKMLNDILTNKAAIQSVVYPRKVEPRSDSMSKLNLLQYSAIIILSIINITSLMNHWLTINETKYNIFYINGASKKMIYFIIFCETLVVSVITFLLGTGIALTISFFTKSFNLYYEVSYSNILLGAIIYIGTLLCAVSVYTIGICKHLNVKNVRMDS